MVRRESISSGLIMCGGGVCSILLWPFVARCLETKYVCARGVMDAVFSVCIVTRGVVVCSCFAGSGVNRVQVVLSGFSKRLFCFVQAITLCRYGCMYFLAALVLVCVDVIVMSSV